MIAWPRAASALLNIVPAIPAWSGVEVFDGPPVTGSAPSEWLTVGFVAEEGSAGDWNQEPGSVDGLVDETGSVRCELVVKGDDMPSTRSRAVTLLDALDDTLRGNQTLNGVLGFGSTVTLGADFLPVQNTSGASVRVAMSISYSTRN